MKIGIIGGGLSGCYLAHLLKADHEVHIFEKDLIGGMCRTEYKEGLAYEYGPHIIYTNDEWIIDIFKKFVGFKPNTFYLATQVEDNFITYPPHYDEVVKLPSGPKIKQELSLTRSEDNTNFRTYLESKLGPTAYKLFYEGFTKKFWQVDPSELNAKWATTRELGFKRDKNAFNAKYQGYPKEDYTILCYRLSDGVSIHYDPVISPRRDQLLTTKGKFKADLFINTISPDSLLNQKLGNLDYRGFHLDLKVYDKETVLARHPTGNKTSWLYNPSSEVPWTRKCEYKTINQKPNPRSIIGTEYPSSDVKYYPFYTDRAEETFESYLPHICSRFDNLITTGRLGLYIYTTMGNTFKMCKEISKLVPLWKKMSYANRIASLIKIRGISRRGA